MSDRLASLTARTLALLGIKPAETETPPDAAAAAAAEAEAARLAAAGTMPADEEDGEDGANDEGDENPDGTPKKSKKKDKGMETAEAAAAEATAAANNRWATVLMSDEAKGRTRSAITMLATTTLDAAAVMSAIASFPKDAAGVFADQMAETPNPRVSADGAAGGAPAADANHGWDKVYASLANPTRK